MQSEIITHTINKAEAQLEFYRIEMINSSNDTKNLFELEIGFEDGHAFVLSHDSKNFTNLDDIATTEEDNTTFEIEMLVNRIKANITDIDYRELDNIIALKNKKAVLFFWEMNNR